MAITINGLIRRAGEGGVEVELENTVETIDS